MTSLLDLPDELLVHLLTHICSDALLLRLALSCRRTAALLDDAELWIARGGARWGREEMAAGVGESGAEGAKTAKEVYKEKSTLLVPATRMSIVHLNGTYWSLGPDSRSPTAHAATLNSVCWLARASTTAHSLSSLPPSHLSRLASTFPLFTSRSQRMSLTSPIFVSRHLASFSYQNYPHSTLLNWSRPSCTISHRQPVLSRSLFPHQLPKPPKFPLLTTSLHRPRV
ncbi:hypothetical protein M427DRAFT_306417 [Gonapodya prolifera JEL478]|uniref:F-box domain-containing protein n=1 Tax=Gonapodya prolifera (strain JEL478) TaxID=1344416 RepID=A0A139AHS6_GONPJ|nr:hypothetical protein M427DRAFT_306417 [Gonapodya prolifera JEL478]|eukprot:KXS15963.1 hypothetical protein M427DRAFT_306417 [Gonapodya prolifera JEL478]